MNGWMEEKIYVEDTTKYEAWRSRVDTYYFLYHTFRTKLRYNSVPQIKITLLHKQQPTSPLSSILDFIIGIGILQLVYRQYTH